MNENNSNFTNLPMMAMKEIPNANRDAKQIVALVKDGGKVTGYQLSDGHNITKEEGILLAKQGGIQGVGISTNRGNEYLKSIPDANEGNNLNSLPSIICKSL